MVLKNKIKYTNVIMLIIQLQNYKIIFIFSDLII